MTPSAIAEQPASTRWWALSVRDLLQSRAETSITARNDERVDRKLALLAVEGELEAIAQQRLHHESHLVRRLVAGRGVDVEAL